MPDGCTKSPMAAVPVIPRHRGLRGASLLSRSSFAAVPCAGVYEFVMTEPHKNHGGAPGPPEAGPARPGRPAPAVRRCAGAGRKAAWARRGDAPQGRLP